MGSQPPEVRAIGYICAGCGEINILKIDDVIKCRECGYHILYKKRIYRKIVVHLAR